MNEEELIIAIMVAATIIFLIPYVFYLITLQKALSKCSPSNRKMKPGLVWLNLIPLFGNIWIFITVSKVAGTLRNEFADRSIPADGGFGLGVGITMSVFSLLTLIPFVGFVALVGYLICWIIHWVSISSYPQKIEASERA